MASPSFESSTPLEARHLRLSGSSQLSVYLPIERTWISYIECELLWSINSHSNLNFLSQVEKRPINPNINIESMCGLESTRKNCKATIWTSLSCSSRIHLPSNLSLVKLKFTNSVWRAMWYLWKMHGYFIHESLHTTYNNLIYLTRIAQAIKWKNKQAIKVDSKCAYLNTMFNNEIVQWIILAATVTFWFQPTSIKSSKTLLCKFWKEKNDAVLILFGTVAKRSTKTCIGMNHCACDLCDPILGFMAPYIFVCILARKHSDLDMLGMGHLLELKPRRGISSSLL